MLSANKLYELKLELEKLLSYEEKVFYEDENKLNKLIEIGNTFLRNECIDYTEKDCISIISNIGKIAYENGKFKEAIQFYLKLNNLILFQNNEMLQLKIKEKIADLYLHLHEYEKAREYLTIVHKEAKKNDFKEIISKTYLNLGYCYRCLNDYDTAINYLTKGIDYAKQHSFIADKIKMINELANIYYLKNDYNKSEELHLKALQLSQEHKINWLSGFILHDLGKLYFNKKEYVKSIDYFLSDISKNLQHYSTRELAMVYLNIASAYYELEDIENCLKYAELAYEYAEDSSSYIVLKEILELKTTLYKREGNFELALIELEKANKLNEKILNEEISYLNKRVETKLELEKFESEIEINRLKNIELTEANSKLIKSFEQLQNAQKEILELEKKNSALAMAVTANHELNQPLMILSANIEMFLATCNCIHKCDNSQKYFKNINISLERINNILRKYRESTTFQFAQYSEDNDMIIFEEE